MRKIISLVSAAILALGFTPSSTALAQDKLKVMTSFNAINELVKVIGGDKVESEMIVEKGAEPHDFEPTPKDLVKLQEAKVLFINGLEMEPWSENLQGVKIVDLSEGVDLIHLGEDADHKEEEKDEHKDEHKEEGASSNTSVADDHDHEGHSHGEYDPHIWLGLNELKVMAKNTEKALSELDPANKEYYAENLKKFVAEADALEKEFKPQMENLKVKSFVTGHEAFAYLCRNLGLEQKAVEGVFGEGEPTPQQIKELTEFIKNEKITTVFLEKGQAPEVIKTLSKETGAKIVEIGTLETEGELIPTLRDTYTKIIEGATN